MEWETDVDKGAECLGTRFMLCMIEKVLLAGLVRRVPVEDVEV